MITIGINGFGRIGKCIFLQLLNHPHIQVGAINAPNISITELEDYLLYDSTHHYSKEFTLKIVSPNEFALITNNGDSRNIHLFSNKDAKQLPWKSATASCEYIIDATGNYLTTTKCEDHLAKYVIMSAPAKDTTPTYIYGANHEKYAGESIVSGSSCTTNCLAPLLRLLNDTYTIVDSNFTTIHATTATQHTVDILGKSARTNRSILNNIIPHTTGASSSITSVLPEMLGKINGTSVRVPVANCSLLDLNVELADKQVTLKDIEKLIRGHALFDVVYQVNTKNLVSGDFITTTTPTILDMKASIDMGKGKFKLMLWYDNEWSYSAQLIRLVQSMNAYNMMTVKPAHYIKNMDMLNKAVVARFDFNVPCVAGEVSDDFRIKSAIPTINTILSKGPKYLVLTSHFGRPTANAEDNSKFSLNFIIPILEKYLQNPVIFLKDGISEETINTIVSHSNTHSYSASMYSPRIFLLENLRFYKEETDYDTMTPAEIAASPVIMMYRQLGDIFISDAFGCVHRKHMSICDMAVSNKPYGYGHLIKREIESLELLTKNKSGQKILGIIGGNKLKDKLPLIDSLKLIPNANIFITGGLAKQYTVKPDDANISVMCDGYGNVDTIQASTYMPDIISQKEFNCYDIGPNSYNTLLDLIREADIIFWNGSLGIIEDKRYNIGSNNLVKHLIKECDKKIIIGGGETASLFNDKPDMPHIYLSTGGGALLDFVQTQILTGRNIPGIDIFT